MIPIQSDFIFALSNPGSENALKLEVEMEQLPWKPSYQRRGFVTLKLDSPGSLAALDVRLACARRLCLSLGKSASQDEAVARVMDAGSTHVHHAVYETRQMRGVHGGPLPARPEHGALIGTVVELGPAEFWAGLHRHGPWLSPDPAGDAGIAMPADSPSRAWLKLEEALRFFDLKLSPADIVVELGCAPGGVVLALLQRGIPVIGVDPAKMADVVLASAIVERQAAPAGRPWFFHCRRPAALASRRDLGQGVTWFMSDMNQSPAVVLKECARFCKMAPGIRGVLITLKLTDPLQIRDKPDWLRSLADLGFRTIRLQQLSVHHKEFALLGLK
ncbi:MAG: SAM-dependent methyltransferase [Akkermansiaceae bacterium]